MLTGAGEGYHVVVITADGLQDEESMAVTWADAGSVLRPGWGEVGRRLGRAAPASAIRVCAARCELDVPG